MTPNLSQEGPHGSGICVLDAALRPDEALNGRAHHKEIGLPIGGVVLHDFFRRDFDPFISYPGVPAVLGIPSIARLNLEFGFDGVRDSAAEAGFQIAILMLVVVRSLQIFEPKLVGAVGPFSASERRRGANKPQHN